MDSAKSRLIRQVFIKKTRRFLEKSACLHPVKAHSYSVISYSNWQLGNNYQWRTQLQLAKCLPVYKPCSRESCPRQEAYSECRPLSGKVTTCRRVCQHPPEFRREMPNTQAYSECRPLSGKVTTCRRVCQNPPEFWRELSNTSSILQNFEERCPTQEAYSEWRPLSDKVSTCRRVCQHQCWAAILKNVSFKAIQIHNFWEKNRIKRYNFFDQNFCHRWSDTNF